MPITGSTVLRRQLGRQLRRLRDAAKVKEVDVVEAGLASRAKLWRIESGQTAIKVGDVRALCWLYKVDQATTDALAKMAFGSSTRGWWEDKEYAGVLPEWFGLYIGLEAAASEIRIYEPEIVQGLLQTPEYLGALFTDSGVHIDDEALQRQVKLREQRQAVLTVRTPPLRMTAIFGAGVLARQVGGRGVMRGQIARLRELSRLSHVDIRVIPWNAGGHAAIHVGGFAILDFADQDDPPIVYLESHTGARYLEKPEELAAYRSIFDLTYRKAVPHRGVQMISAEWKKSRRSGTNGGSCVEVRRHAEAIQLRDSKDPDGPVLTFTAKEWAAFVGGARDGEFDL